MSEHRLARAPDYTVAALVMLGVNLAWIFLALWAAFGLLPVLLAALTINHAITRLAKARAAPDSR